MDQVASERSTPGGRGPHKGGSSEETRTDREYAASEASGLSAGPCIRPRSSASSDHARRPRPGLEYTLAAGLEDLPGVVVTECGDARRGYPDDAVNDRPISLRRQKKGHVANAQGPFVIRQDLHDLRLAESRIHAGADISGEEHSPCRANPAPIPRLHC
jgi:hypothetical protein